MQIEKAPANQENIFISLTEDGVNAHNTNKERNTLQMLTTQPNTFYLQRVSFLVVLWAFAVCFFICLCCGHLQVCVVKLRKLFP